MNRMISSLAVLVFVTNYSVAEESKADLAAQNKARLDHLITLSKQFTLTSEDEKTEFSLSKPILNYTNQVRERGTTNGVSRLWLSGKRPVAACSFSIRRPGTVHFEFTSLDSQPMWCRDGVQEVWRPQTFNKDFLPIPSKTAGKVDGPHVRPSIRLSQMRRIADRFKVTCVRRRTGEKTELRLLTQPIYRYDAPDEGIIDGALFAFVVTNDPELYLQVEATADSNGQPIAWRFSLARMSSLREVVLLDGEPVWEIENYYEKGRVLTRPYMENQYGEYDLSK